MEFNPHNPIVQRCLQGMALEDVGKPEEAGTLFLQAWHEATHDFEKFIAAHYVARHQTTDSDRLKWHQTALAYALKTNYISVKSAFPTLYSNIAKCHEALGNADEATKNYELSASYEGTPADEGPFYHGTKADLQVGDLLMAGGTSNYQPDLTMNHIYFTALAHGAGLAASLAKGEGRERVYIVEPTGDFENDPNVTDKKFPGNLTRSYRSLAPLKIVGELTDWTRQTPEQLQRFREKLATNTGEIIN